MTLTAGKTANCVKSPSPWRPTGVSEQADVSHSATADAGEVKEPPLGRLGWIQLAPPVERRCSGDSVHSGLCTRLLHHTDGCVSVAVQTLTWRRMCLTAPPSCTQGIKQCHHPTTPPTPGERPKPPQIEELKQGSDPCSSPRHLSNFLANHLMAPLTSL